VVIDDFDIARASFPPDKTNAPLVVYATTQSAEGRCNPVSAPGSNRHSVTRTCGGSEMWTWGVALGREGMGIPSRRFLPRAMTGPVSRTFSRTRSGLRLDDEDIGPSPWSASFECETTMFNRKRFARGWICPNPLETRSRSQYKVAVNESDNGSSGGAPNMAAPKATV
jgi:hypothetical protein